MVECSEKSSKEQDFGDNKENYAIAKAFLNGWSVMSLKGAFSDNVSSSLIYCKYVCCQAKY